jgi:uncharacterized membrane protein YeaQ/YmgE (transglycosylase-associated protein family)
MSIIWTILIGLIAGALAKFIMPGKGPGGIIVTILIGIVGSILFTYLGKFLGLYEEGETAGFFGAVIGAIILLFLYNLFKKKSAV